MGSVEITTVDSVANPEQAGQQVTEVLPPGWELVPFYRAFATEAEVAKARMIELSGHLDFWNQEPDLYG